VQEKRGELEDAAQTYRHMTLPCSGIYPMLLMAFRTKCLSSSETARGCRCILNIWNIQNFCQ